MNTDLIKSFSKTLLAIGIASATSVAQAGSFGLIEQSSSTQGAAHAGAAALAEDASTIYFNPAGMTRLSGTQIVVGGHIIEAQADFTDKGSTGVTGPNSKTDQTGFVPNFYVSSEMDGGVFVGVGVNVPFGLATEYDENWIGRYHAVRSEIKSVNINPSIAWKPTDRVSVGFGLSIQYLELDLVTRLNTGALCFGLHPTNDPTCGAGTPRPDSKIEQSGSSTEIGWNAGVLIELNDSSRLGVAYRSAIKHDVAGSTTYTLDPALKAVADGATAATGFNILQSGSLAATAELPDSFSLSYVLDVSKEWTVLADWTWVGWNSLDTVTIREKGGVPGREPQLELAYQNTNRYSVGVNYHANESLVYRAGVALDETPIRSAETTSARIPGNDRTWLSVGAGYAPSASWSFDVAYSHLFLSDTDIDNANSTGQVLKGTYDSSVDILSAQANFNF